MGMFGFFRRNSKPSDTRTEWNDRGKKFAKEVNEMVSFAEKNGWDAWKGKDPKDERDHFADEVVRLLKEANANGTVGDFRDAFPPAHTPLIRYFQQHGEHIGPLHSIGGNRLVFTIGAYYEPRRTCLLEGDVVTELAPTIELVGKAKRGNVYATLGEGIITTTQGWQGPVIAHFVLDITKMFPVEDMIPFNDGERVLLVTSEGIYVVSTDKEELLHPVPDPAEVDGGTNIDMANATLSHENQFIVVGDQCSEHRVLDGDGKEIGSIGQRSEYPHFCLFSSNDSQLITNSCHFYNGITIGVDASVLKGLRLPPYEEVGPAITIDDGMRIYVGLAVRDHYILGDAHGYVRAIDTHGKCLWRHFVGSTITGLAISPDEQVLWVGSCTGMIHKLRLGKGHRDDQTIGNGEHFEEFRMIFWKGEPVMKW